MNHHGSLGIFVETFATQIKLLRELVSELALGMFHDRKMEGEFVTLNEFNELSFDSLAPSRMIRVERKGKDRVLHFLDPRFSLLNSQRGRESQVSFRDGASIRALDVSTSVSFWSVGGGRTACPLFQVATGAAHLDEEGAGSRDRTGGRSMALIGTRVEAKSAGFEANLIASLAFSVQVANFAAAMETTPKKFSTRRATRHRLRIFRASDVGHLLLFASAFLQHEERTRRTRWLFVARVGHLGVATGWSANAG